MGTIKRLNDAQQRLQDAENAMPGPTMTSMRKALPTRWTRWARPAVLALTLPRQTAATRTH